MSFYLLILETIMLKFLFLESDICLFERSELLFELIDLIKVLLEFFGMLLMRW